MIPEPAPDFSGFRQLRAKQPGKVRKHVATVIALDPGGTTGWSVMSVHPDSLVENEVSIIENIQYWTHGQTDCGATKGNLGSSKHIGISTSGEAAGVAELVGLLRAWPGAAVVIEDFVIRQFNQDRDFLAPVRITGALSQWLWQLSRDYYVQQPAFAKTTATDVRLKQWGIYNQSGGMVHARDADRHAITFLRQCKMDPAFRIRAFKHVFGPGEPYDCSHLLKTPKRWEQAGLLPSQYSDWKARSANSAQSG